MNVLVVITACISISRKEHLPAKHANKITVCFPVQSDDGTVTPDSWHTQWTNHMMEAGEKIGRPLNATQQYKTQLEAAGFVDVVVEVQKWPINQWSKDKKAKQVSS